MESGSRLDGYELIRVLGAGGMGEVWLATDLQLGRKVAVKLLPPALTADPARVARFEHEARAASSLNHPNVCTIHALGHTADGQRFIAMELVDGRSLRERMAAGALSRTELLSFGVQIAAALTASHAAGVIHRDLKPENVMVRPDGLVKVVDFGLAKLTDTGGTPTSTTQLLAHTVAGAIVGTVMYMSPEQARGLPVDARTDIWSLGVILFEMLEGRPPFNGETATDILAAILGTEPVLRESGSGVSQELRRIIGKALRKDREQRYQVMKDLELDLQALRDDREPQVMVSSGPNTATAVRGRSPLWIAAASVVIATAGLLWWWMANHTTQGSSAREIRRVAIDRPVTRLTFDEGLQTDPAFSPDRRLLAYASDHSGNFDIWVQPVEGGPARQVTTSSAQETQPAWSPDGSTLVYRTEGSEGGLFTVPAEGGAGRRVTSFGEHATWVSNREILFVGGERGGGRVFSVPSDGIDPPRPLLEGALRGAYWSWIAPHPDGRISMLGWDETGATKFVTASRDGTQITTSAISKDLRLDNESLRRFTWSPSGDSLYLEVLDQNVAGLWKIYVDPGTLNWREAERLTRGTDGCVAATISSDGTRLGYSTQRTATQLWTFPLEGDATPRLGKGKAMSPVEGRVANATLSPDGKFAAYVMNRPGAKHSELTLADLTTERMEVLAVDGFWPAWSHDSRHLAYVVMRQADEQPEFAIVTRPLAGAEKMLKRWSDESLFIPSAWFEDGEVLGSLLKPFYGRAVLATWATPGDVPARVLLDDENASFYQGAISPNGRWIAFTVAPKSGSPFVGIAPATGSPSAKFAEPFGHEITVDKPRWSADGRTLFVLAKNGQPFLNVWSVRFDPDKGTTVGGLTQVSRFDSPGFGVATNQDENDIGVAAHVVALPMTTASGGIWMMENADK